MSKVSWINTVLSWIGKKLGSSPKPQDKSVAAKTCQPEPSTQNTSGNKAYLVWVETEDGFKTPNVFCSDKTLSEKLIQHRLLAGRIAGITGCFTRLHHNEVGKINTWCTISPKVVNGVRVLMVTNRNSKVYARNRSFTSYINQLKYLVETYKGAPVTLYYYDDTKPGEPAFFTQTFIDGIFHNVKTS